MTAAAHHRPGRGRPLRFVAMVAMGWIALRVVLLWPAAGSLSKAIEQAVPLPQFAAIVAPAEALPERGSVRTLPPRSQASAASALALPPPPASLVLKPVVPPGRVQFAMLGLIGFGPTLSDALQGDGPLLAPARVVPGASGHPVTIDGSAWLLSRSGANGGPGRLGGSQAGARLRVAIPGTELAAATTVSAPLDNAGKEARIGVEWQPTRAPVRVVADQRVALDHGTVGGPELALVGGVNPTPIGAGLTLEAYGQGGAIARERIEPYVDGALRVTRTGPKLGRAQLSLGAGLWAGAQRDAQRVDIGPTLVSDIPVGNRHLRLSVDWRARVGGGAAPGSGPAITLGTNF